MNGKWEKEGSGSEHGSHVDRQFPSTYELKSLGISLITPLACEETVHAPVATIYISALTSQWSGTNCR